MQTLYYAPHFYDLRILLQTSDTVAAEIKDFIPVLLSNTRASNVLALIKRVLIFVKLPTVPLVKIRFFIV